MCLTLKSSSTNSNSGYLVTWYLNMRQNGLKTFCTGFSRGPFEEMMEERSPLGASHLLKDIQAPAQNAIMTPTGPASHLRSVQGVKAHS